METQNLFRTDLAIEEHERTDCTAGVSVKKITEEKTKILIDIVKITGMSASIRLKKPPGTYVTLSQGSLDGHTDEDIQMSAAVAGHVLKRLLPVDCGSILVAGLGNADMTADSLGPSTVAQLLVNRHLPVKKNVSLSAIAPGVMGQTGLEAAQVAKGVINEIHPDALIVVDALAACSYKRLLSTIQLSDAGICPGSGVGNHRCELSKKTLGIPVISVGAPTVIGVFSLLQSMAENEIHVREDELEALDRMCVTSKDIDVCIKELSSVLAEGIHHLVYKHQPDIR